MSPDAKATIDALSRDELRLEVAKGNRSRFQREKYAYAIARLAQLSEQEANQQGNLQIGLMQEANSIAQGANDIARAANDKAAWANWIALLAALLAAIALIID